MKLYIIARALFDEELESNIIEFEGGMTATIFKDLVAGAVAELGWDVKVDNVTCRTADGRIIFRVDRMLFEGMENEGYLTVYDGKGRSNQLRYYTNFRKAYDDLDGRFLKSDIRCI